MICAAVQKIMPPVVSVYVEARLTPFDWSFEEVAFQTETGWADNENLAAEVQALLEDHRDLICRLYGLTDGCNPLEFRRCGA